MVLFRRASVSVAGMGPDSVCNHRILVLPALTEHGKRVPIITQETGTQWHQIFHAVKPHKGSSVKALSLKLKIKSTESETRPTTSQIDDESYQEYFAGVVRNSAYASHYYISPCKCLCPG